MFNLLNVGLKAYVLSGCQESGFKVFEHVCFYMSWSYIWKKERKKEGKEGGMRRKKEGGREGGRERERKKKKRLIKGVQRSRAIKERKGRQMFSLVKRLYRWPGPLCFLHILYHLRACASHSVVSDSLWLYGLYLPHQAVLSMEFSRKEYWSRSPFHSLGDLPDPDIKPRSPALQADSLPSEPPGKLLTHPGLPPQDLLCGV